MAVCAGAMLWGSAAGAEGVTWSDLTLAQALAKADDLATLVMIDVYASHCMQCKDMDREVWETPEGAELAEGLIMLRIPSDKPEGRTLQDNYPVLGLPLVILLEADGTERGRIVNYRTPEPFFEQARALKAGFDPLPEMEAELEAQPTSQKLTFEIFEQYLYRQREAEAGSLLARLLELDSRRISTYATKALGLAARYYDYFKHGPVESRQRRAQGDLRVPPAEANTDAVDRNGLRRRGRQPQGLHLERGGCPLGIPGQPDPSVSGRGCEARARSGGQAGDLRLTGHCPRGHARLTFARPGMYFYRLGAGAFSRTRQVLIAR
jgi:hypothetical protein